MAQPAPNDELLRLVEAARRFGVKRSTLYRHIRKCDLVTYRRAMDKRAYVRRADLEALRRFRAMEGAARPGVSAVERARGFQRRVFGGGVFTTTSAE
jgi:hypothetical protein